MINRPEGPGLDVRIFSDGQKMDGSDRRQIRFDWTQVRTGRAGDILPGLPLDFPPGQRRN